MRAELKLKSLQVDRKPKALYRGFQSDGDGGGFKLYDVVWEENPYNGSTVGTNMLIKLGIKDIIRRSLCLDSIR